MSNPKVSVIIPVYNVENYIERCARSLFEQTIDDIEYIFIDDCTPDRSITILKEILEDFPHRKPQVVIHRMAHNSGQARVREWGCKHASGEYVIHCDTDDWVETNMYEIMYKAAVEGGCDITICNYDITDGISHTPDKSLPNYINSSTDTIRKGLVSGDIHRALWNKLVRRSLYNNDISYPPCNMWEDVTMIIQLAIFSKSIKVIDKCLYHYFLSPNSISMQKGREAQLSKLEQVKSNISLIERFFADRNKSKEYAPEILKMKLGALKYAKGVSRKFYSSVFPLDNISIALCGIIPLGFRVGHLTRLIGIRK